MLTGSRPSLEWAAKNLKTKSDQQEVEDLQPFWSLFDVSPTLPQHSLDDLVDTAFFPNTLTAAPGWIHAANDEVVEHNASVIPGISGGAGKPFCPATSATSCFLTVAGHQNVVPWLSSAVAGVDINEP